MSPRTSTITVGRRKTAVARLKVIKKTDEKLIITVNEKDIADYFPQSLNRSLALEPLKLAGIDKINLAIRVSGGGTTSQAEAVRHAIARAIIKLEPETRTALKKEGMLTRDDRRKERKKPGLKKARRAPQWAKR